MSIDYVIALGIATRRRPGAGSGHLKPAQALQASVIAAEPMKASDITAHKVSMETLGGDREVGR